MIINVPNVCGPWQGSPLYHKFASFFFFCQTCADTRSIPLLRICAISNELHLNWIFVILFDIKLHVDGFWVCLGIAVFPQMVVPRCSPSL